jgi:hypothetical protein
MPNDFTYAPPDEVQYLKAVLLKLKRQGCGELCELLKNAKCSIHVSSSFSRRRWDALYTTITFRLPSDDYEKLDPEREASIDRNTLISICDNIMPAEAGLDVMHVEFSPTLETDAETKTLEDDLREITKVLQDASADFTLPSDIIDKGREMAEAYLYLYAVENYLRLFIEKASAKQYGGQYFSKLNISRSIATAIDT